MDSKHVFQFLFVLLVLLLLHVLDGFEFFEAGLL